MPQCPVPIHINLPSGMANFSSDGSVCIERKLSMTHIDDVSLDIVKYFDLKEACDWIKKNRYKKVCLQFPDSLLTYSDKVYDEIKSRVEVDVYVLADTTFSSCCVDEVTAMHVKADAIVHYGHSCLSTCSVPVFISLPKNHLHLSSTEQILQDYCSKFDNDSNLCLFYDAAYEHLQNEISNMWFSLKPNGFIAKVDKSRNESNICSRIIVDKRCILKTEDIYGFTCIYIGSQSQTLFNCIISLDVQWVLLDTESKRIISLNESVWFKRRRYLIEKCKDANNIGILVCKLSGQTTMEIIRRMKELCKKRQKKSYIISVGKPNVQKLANFPEIDIYVLIACPENELYSSRDFYRPLVYPYELEVALNDRPYLQNQHVTDFEHLLESKRYYYQFNEQEEKMDVSLISGKIRGSQIHQTNKEKSLEKAQLAVQTIGENLSFKTWSGLEQKLGETPVNKVETGRSGLPISYENEPKDKM